MPHAPSAPVVHIDAFVHRFGDAAAFRYLAAGGKPLPWSGFHAVVALWRRRRAAPLSIATSDHLLRDMSLVRDDIIGADASRHEAWSWPPAAT